MPEITIPATDADPDEFDAFVNRVQAWLAADQLDAGPADTIYALAQMAAAGELP